MARYNFRETEAKWQAVWEDRGCFKAQEDEARPKYYVLEMFPYPSGRLHVGHVRNYAIGDVVARYRRARGYNVLNPMRSEEHTSELQSLMRSSYAVFCLITHKPQNTTHYTQRN